MTCYASNNRSLMLTHFDTCLEQIKITFKKLSEYFTLGWELYLYSTVRRFSLLTFHEFPPKPLDFLYKTTGLSGAFRHFLKIPEIKSVESRKKRYEQRFSQKNQILH